MTINFSTPERSQELKPRITVVGVGGAGGNAVNNMIRSNLTGVEFLVANTDAQALALSMSERRVQLGLNLTHGLGAGSRPDIGRAAAEEALDEILEHLTGSHMVFITAGMGGGTGTGAAPVIARAAREQGVLTVGVVTRPFLFEGTHRTRLADPGLEELGKYVDTLIVVPNQNLFRIANEKTTFAQAFQLADDVLYAGVRGVTDLMVMPGLINLDFADIRTVMSEMGKAMMGTGEASGDRRAVDAAEAAISNPLLDDVSMKGARGVLINITGGPDMTLFEVDEAANRIRDEVDPEANIIFGATFDDTIEGMMRVSVVATGIEAERALNPVITKPEDQEVPGSARLMPFPLRPHGNAKPIPVIGKAGAQPERSDAGQQQAAPSVPPDAQHMPIASMRPAAGPTWGMSSAATALAYEDDTEADRQFIAPRPVASAEPRPPVQGVPVIARPVREDQPRRDQSTSIFGRFAQHVRGRRDSYHPASAEQQAHQPSPRDALLNHGSTDHAPAAAPADQNHPGHYAYTPERQRPPQATAEDPRARASQDQFDRNEAWREEALDIPTFLRRRVN